MKKVKGLIDRHKILTLICLVAVVTICILGYAFLTIFVGGENKYGNRLDGISKVEITKDKKSEVTTKLKENDGVSDASIRVQGKIIYISIVFNNDVSLDNAKKIASGCLDNFSSEEKSFYDFGYFLTQDSEEGFNITGTKHVGLDTISFIRS